MRLQAISSTAKEYAKKSLEQGGWYVRKAVGLSSGVDCFLEMRDRLGIDVGAHRGETVVEIARRFPAARIFAFEPVASNFLALGDRDGSEDIFIQDDTQTHTLKRPPMNGTAPQLRHSKIDLLKIDVEGFELEVLVGARRALVQTPPRLILAEASLDPSDQVHTSFEDIAGCLRQYGYRLLSIYDQVVWLSPIRLAYFNALFAHE